MTAPTTQPPQEWSEDEIALLKELAPLAWGEWQTSFFNPDPEFVDWTELAPEIQNDWLNVMGKIVGYWELRRQEQS